MHFVVTKTLPESSDLNTNIRKIILWFSYFTFKVNYQSTV